MKASENRYIRNRIYLSDKEQDIIKRTPIFLAGCGIGSVIAECALRIGFENITLVDGDKVELSNINRQNYTEKDIAVSKAEAIKQRLLSINSNANINVHNCYLTTGNLRQFILGHKIAINALDFSSEVPLAFDSVCKENGIWVLHPYNIGWGGIVAVISPESAGLDSISRPNKKFSEVEFVEYALSHLNFRGKPAVWAKEALETYLAEEERISPPQLSIGSWLVASMCTNILFDIAVGKEVKTFPRFYFSSLK